jgi:hypothetical protein
VNDGGFFAAVLFLFSQLIFVFAEVHDPANRRLGIRRQLDEIQPGGVGARHRLLNRHDADLIAVSPNEPNFRNPDLMIDPDKFFLGRSANSPPDEVRFGSCLHLEHEAQRKVLCYSREALGAQLVAIPNFLIESLQQFY